MSAQLADDSSDGDDANLVGLRALGEDSPLVDPSSDSFELDLGVRRRVVIPMDRGAQHRGVGASGTEAASETGAVVWDGAVLLARANQMLPSKETGRTVLELGAGCGLAGLAWALTEDCDLTLTDRPHRLQALRENAARNGVDATVAALDWTRVMDDARADCFDAIVDGRPGSSFFGGFDVVLAADCVYDEALATPLCRTISYAMAASSVALVTIDEANRRPGALKAFLRIAERAFSSLEEVPMASRGWSKGDDRESIRLFVLRGPRLFDSRKPLRIVVAGPCGCGKTTIGKALAAVLGLPFVEGDDLHPEANVAKMARGEPLTDADRAPWLQTVSAALWNKTAALDEEAIAAKLRAIRLELEQVDYVPPPPPLGAVASCSALKRKYRDELGPVCIALLDVPEAVALARVRARAGHFMPASLVASQYEALEMPGRRGAFVFDGTLEPSSLVDTIIETVARCDPRDLHARYMAQLDFVGRFSQGEGAITAATAPGRPARAPRARGRPGRR